MFQEDGRMKKATPSKRNFDERTGNDSEVADVSGNKDGDNPGKIMKLSSAATHERTDIVPGPDKDDKNDPEITINFSQTARTDIDPDKDDQNDPKINVNFSPRTRTNIVPDPDKDDKNDPER